jgi:hypothetical protein
VRREKDIGLNMALMIPKAYLEAARIRKESINPAAPIVIPARAINIPKIHFLLTLSVSFPKYNPQNANGMV